MATVAAKEKKKRTPPPVDSQHPRAGGKERSIAVFNRLAILPWLTTVASLRAGHRDMCPANKEESEKWCRTATKILELFVERGIGP
jgi:hypothetical protein